MGEGFLLLYTSVQTRTGVGWGCEAGDLFITIILGFNCSLAGRFAAHITQGEKTPTVPGNVPQQHPREYLLDFYQSQPYPHSPTPCLMMILFPDRISAKITVMLPVTSTRIVHKRMVWVERHTTFPFSFLYHGPTSERVRWKNRFESSCMVQPLNLSHQFRENSVGVSVWEAHSGEESLL